jgi:hypothetical protein
MFALVELPGKREGARTLTAIASRRGPRKQYNSAAESAVIDAGMDLARGSERQAVDDDGVDSSITQQPNSVAMSALNSFRCVARRAVML